MITQAVTILQQGGIVAFPTETVYGLGADAMQEAAIRKIFQAKGRPYDHPLIVHVARVEQLSAWAREVSPQAWVLAKHFWPGPLTLVLKKQPWVLDSVTGGQETVGIRIPAHPVAQQLLQAFGGGIVAPSANRFTHVSPTTAEAVYEELGDKVDLILDGGACEVGLESTIVDMSGDMPVILRPGMITADAIAAVLGLAAISLRSPQAKTRAPGMHHVHYAPTTPARLVETADVLPLIHALTPQEAPIALMLHSDLTLPSDARVHVIRMPREAAAYAHDLYQQLRTADHLSVKQIIIEQVPHDAAWMAIRDRLMKASQR